MALHPEIKLMLENLYASDWVDPAELTPQQARAQSDRFAKLRQFPGELPDVSATDYYIPVDSNQKIVARCYYPKKQSYSFVVIFYHGGGYVVSDVNQYNTTCSWMCSVLEMPVISVDYRLAPENPFPTPIHDGYQSLCWIADNLKKLNVNCENIIVAGDSAGGHLATMVSILARDKSGPKISWQWLLYPWIDNDFSRKSYETFYSGFGLSTNAIRWYTDHYLKDNRTADFPTFPLHFTDFNKLPPTYIIVAENDILLDEGKHYAEQLSSSGNTVHFELAEGMIHGFINLYPIPASFNVTLKLFQKMKNLIHESVIL